MSKDPSCIVEFSPLPPRCDDVYHAVPVPSSLVLIVSLLVILLRRVGNDN